MHPKKVASIFDILADRFGEKTESQIKIMIPLSHQDVAELVGISRETASIEIKKLIDEELIERKSKYYYVNKPALLHKKASL